jgi:hypothetical protein
MENLIYYIAIGAVFMFSIELLMRTKKVGDKLKELKKGDIEFTIYTRILGILIWPLALFIFVKAFLQEIFKK